MSVAALQAMPDLHFRALTVDELPLVLNRPEIHDQDLVPLGPTDLSNLIRFWVGATTDGYGHVVGIECDGRLAGVIGWVEHRDLFSTAVLAAVGLWVVFDRADRQRGYGHHLLAFLEDYCDDQGFVLCAHAPATDDGLRIARALTARGYRMFQTSFARQPERRLH